jgi:hypothetical protein
MWVPDPQLIGESVGRVSNRGRPQSDSSERSVCGRTDLSFAGKGFAVSAASRAGKRSTERGLESRRSHSPTAGQTPAGISRVVWLAIAEVAADRGTEPLPWLLDGFE